MTLLNSTSIELRKNYWH